MSTHTPGPWEIDRDVRTSINMGAKHVALVNFYNSPDQERNVSGEEHEANVRLIAAAPDLLAIAQEACAIFDRNYDADIDYYGDDLASDLWKDDIHEKLVAALAKAMGAK